MAPRRVERIDGYAGLRDYGVLSDMRATALVALDGRIDWMAAPAMDEQPLCAAILDACAGGSVGIEPTLPYEASHRYLDDTLLVETTFVTDEGRVRVTDSLNLGTMGVLPWTELARVVEVEEGRVPLRWWVEPRHSPGEGRPWAFERSGSALLSVGEQQVGLVTGGTGKPELRGHRAEGTFTAEAGEPAVLGLIVTGSEPVLVPAPEDVRQRQRHTADHWRQWCERIDYDGPWATEVRRSALAIKALTLDPTSGIAAAATTSLPERIGGSRNFDYRFAWIRDASFALDAATRLGLTEETHGGISWMLSAVSQNAPEVRVFYSVGGDPVPPTMRQADGMPGYRCSPPVNVGNDAANQLQLGAYGDLFRAVLRYTEHGGRLDSGTAGMLAGLADHLCQIWLEPDAGLWELGDQQRYTTSKIGSWAALDSAVRLHEAGQIASLDVDRWRMERDDIRAWTDEHCWSSAKQSYTFYAGTEDLDAGVLLAARTGFCSGDDERLHTTIDAVRAELTAEGPLLYRYSGMQEKEGAFLACSCWLVEALAHAGRVEEARSLIGGFVDRTSGLGLLSEEMDPVTGELLGNIPQALSHLSLVNAAVTVSDALGRA